MPKEVNCSVIVDESMQTIKINKNGDEISINIDDRENINKIMKMVMKFKESTSEHLKDPDVDSLNKLCDETEKDMKELFGDDILIKVFNLEHPSLRLLIEFFGKFWNVIAKINESKNEQTVKNLEKIYGDKYFDRLSSK